MRCADLDTFFDGELGEAEASAFRDHLGTCDRCQAKLLGRMQEEIVVPQPPRVAEPVAIPLAARQSRRPRRIALYIGSGAATAAAAVAALLATRTTTEPAPLAFGVEIQRTGSAVRSSSVHLGDTLHIAARGERHRAIWVFVDDVLVAACPGTTGCAEDDDRMTLDLPVKLRGEYNLVVLAAKHPIGEASATFDAALAGAANANVSYQLQKLDVD